MKKLYWSLSAGLQHSDALLVIFWLIALFVVSPFGEFPVNDDWAYAKNVRHLAIEGRFVVDRFPAMNLVSQTLYGSFFVWCFGFSFVTLRMSIFLLCILSSFALKKIVQGLNSNNQWFSLFFVVIFFFNPMMLELSFTFMTDMFFVSMVIFAVYFLFAYKQHNKPMHYVLFVLFCMIAVLCRQHGLLFSFMSLLLLSGNRKKTTKFFLISLPPVLTWLAHDKYRHYLAEYHISNGINYSDKLYEYLANAPPEYHLNHASDMAVVTGLFLLPLVILIPFWGNPGKRKVIHLSIPFLLLTGFLIYYLRENYPLGNITTVLQCGPKVVKVDSRDTYQGWLETVRIIQLLAGSISISAILITIILRKSALSKLNKLLPLIFLGITAVLFVFIAISNAYFDRYTIPLIMLLGIVLIPSEPFSFDKRTKTMAIVMCTLLYGIAIMEVKDFFKWQDVRWKALNELNARGIHASQIDGGFEYNSWYKPSKGWPEKGKSWWWVKDDEFVVSKQRLKYYEVEKVYSFNRLIPFGTDSIYVLKRKPGD